MYTPKSKKSKNCKELSNAETIQFRFE
jgi:hypothetical protein